MKKNKKSLFVRYRKEALILSLGCSLVCLLLCNLRSPITKQDLASNDIFLTLNKAHFETMNAAGRVESEQEEQSLMLSEFKKKYSKFVQTKDCLKIQNCRSSHLLQKNSDTDLAFKSIRLQLKELRSHLVSNWFRLNTKTRQQVVSSIELENSQVKEQVLELLLELNLEESKLYLPLVLSEVIDKNESNLVAKTFSFIKKTATPENEILVAKRLVDAMMSGDLKMSQAISEQLAVIISPNTDSIYKAALSNLPKHSKETDFLSKALNQNSSPSDQIVNR